ncbi:MAG: hypothetical protein QOE36_3821 [Gaiellaceae bacterium]|nr:hypothetical protein [Gaiellaceae bacterium]
MLIVYAIVVSVFAGIHYSHRTHDPPPIIEERLLALRGALDGLDRGGPPLAAPADSPARKYMHLEDTGGRWVALPPADSPGLYVYVPVLAHLRGTKDVEHITWLFFLVLWSVLVFVVTIVFGELLGLIPGIVAPLLVLWKFDFVLDTDYYWIPAWTVIVSLALLMLVRRPRAWMLVPPLVVASFGDSMRFGCGVAAFLVACTLVLTRVDGWAARFRLLAVSLLAYVSISGIAMSGLVLYRDSQVTATPSTPRSFWHTAYIGLGFLPNSYGIRYDDGIGLITARKRDPGVVYLSPAYNADMRTAYWSVVRKHPTFALQSYWTKVHVAVRRGLSTWSLGILLAPLLGLFGPGRREFRQRATIAAAGVAVTALPGLLAIPSERYLLGFEGALGLLWMLSLLTLLQLVVQLVRSRATSPLEVPRAWVAASAALVALALVAAYAPVPSAARALTDQSSIRRRTYANHSALVSAPIPGTDLGRTSFTAAPAPFSPVPGVQVEPAAGGLRVTTTGEPRGYQILFPVQRLQAGRYAFVLRGRVEDGGIGVGALDAGADVWMSFSSYWSGQPGMGTLPLTVTFQVERPTRVRLILSNWGSAAGRPDARSRWNLVDVRLRRLS